MNPFRVIVNSLEKWLAHESSPHQGSTLCDFERIRYELKPADVLLIEGQSRVAGVIKQVTQSPWSHAALYIGKLHDIEDKRLREYVNKSYDGNNEDQLIIESELGFGTVIRSLQVYEGKHVRICRPNGMSYRDGQQVIHYSVSRLGHEYDIRQILDLLRFLLPYRVIPSRWRSSLFSNKSGQATRTVCSTMIAEAFSFIHFPILPLVKLNGKKGVQIFHRNPKLCTPRDFDYSPYFTIIKYPFLDFSQHSSDCRLLPWHGESTLESQELGLYMTTGQIRDLKRFKDKLGVDPYKSDESE
ncbi:MAG: hypothetical protein KAG53_07335 [Endozoicomonadaceae bacterium]|nr:hypothetical protein [Endozoicomonadaceae bacterium]